MKKTFVQFVLDRSGSMTGNPLDTAKKLIVSLSDQIAERSRQAGLSVDFGVTHFDNEVTGFATPERSPTLADLGAIYARGGTHLFQAVSYAVNAVLNRAGTLELVDPEVAFLVHVLTDGWDNDLLQRERIHELRQTLARLLPSNRWTFVFNVPPGSREELIRKLGVPQLNENFREWTTDSAGLRETVRANDVGTQTYMAARASGATASTTFYRQTVDASKLDVSKLTDVSRGFKAIKVDKESEIRPFVEDATQKPYVIGAGYYQLTKREKIQPSKNILIRKKGEKTIYGGLEAKQMLGLHTGPTDVNIVTPGNLGDYDIFVQSRVVNRKLVRGTTLLLDVLKKQGDKPTWDHTLGGTR